MTTFFSLLVSGLATGAIYALIAVGFTLLWQTSQTINFAQGEFVMLPAFFILGGTHLGLPFPLAIAGGFALSFLVLGLAYKRLLVDPMLRHGVLPLAIAGMALAVLMREAVKEFVTAEAQPFPSLFPDTNFNIMGGVISLQSVGIIIIAAVAITLLQLLLTRTYLGQQMQATAQNFDVARLLGIRVERMVLFAFMLNAGLVALAAVLITPIYLAKFSSGEVMGMFAFVAAIVGGFNQVRGALVGGLLLGVVDNLGAAYISAEYRTALPLLFLVVIILFRPEGLLGRAEERTV